MLNVDGGGVGGVLELHHPRVHDHEGIDSNEVFERT